MADNRLPSSKTPRTIYASGAPMLTPMDVVVRKEVHKFENFEHDRLKLEAQRKAGTVDPFAEGPYALTLDGPTATPSSVIPAEGAVTPAKTGPTRLAKGPAATPDPTPVPRAEKKPAAPVTTSPPAAGPPPAVSPPGISRPVYTGGAPALAAAEMDQAIIDGSPILKGLYALPEKFALVRTGYMGLTRYLGPLGAFANVGYNIVNAKRIWQDPHAPGVLKGGIIASTALAGVSAVTATRLAASAFGFAPMATSALKTMGKLCGETGLGAGTLLSAMDTYNTFRDPNSTPAEKGMSTLATVASVALTAVVMAGLTGPVGIVLGVGVIALTLGKGLLAHNATANKVFGAVGNFCAKLKFW